MRRDRLAAVRRHPRARRRRRRARRRRARRARRPRARPRPERAGAATARRLAPHGPRRPRTRSRPLLPERGRDRRLRPVARVPRDRLSPVRRRTGRPRARRADERGRPRRRARARVPPRGGHHGRERAACPRGRCERRAQPAVGPLRLRRHVGRPRLTGPARRPVRGRASAVRRKGHRRRARRVRSEPDRRHDRRRRAHAHVVRVARPGTPLPRPARRDRDRPARACHARTKRGGAVGDGSARPAAAERPAHDRLPLGRHAVPHRRRPQRVLRRDACRRRTRHERHTARVGALRARPPHVRGAGDDVARRWRRARRRGGCPRATGALAR